MVKTIRLRHEVGTMFVENVEDLLNKKQLKTVINEPNFFKFDIFPKDKDGEEAFVACHHKVGDPTYHFYAQIVVGYLKNFTFEERKQIREFRKTNVNENI